MRIEEGSFQGLEVFVELDDGTRLNEYPGPVDTTFSKRDEKEITKTLCCYLECPADRSKSFKVAFKTTGEMSSDCHVRCWADGQKIPGKTWQSSKCPKAVGSIFKTINGAVHEFPLKFGRLATTDDIASAMSPDLSLSAGRIEVTLAGIVYTGPKRAAQRVTTDLNGKPIHEKAKRAFVDTSIQLGEGKPCVPRPQSFQPFQYLRPTELDLVVVFLYRSRELLLAQDVIERPVSNPIEADSATAVGTVEALDRQRAIQEAEELRERLRALEGQIAGGSDTKPILKRPESQSTSGLANKRPRQSDAGGNIIDLTCDSD